MSASGAVVLLSLFLGSVLPFQNGLVFYPDNPPGSRLNVDSVPAGVPHENLFILTKDSVQIHLLLLPYTGEDSGVLTNISTVVIPVNSSPPSALTTILYFHGNAGNIGHRVPNARLMVAHLKANVVLVEYRGYGKSEGEPSEDGLYLDAQASLDYVTTRPDLNTTKVVLFGRSLGGAVAIRLAADNPHRVAAIMLENTFLSIPDMAAKLVFFLPMKWLPLSFYSNQFLSYQQVAHCPMPSLFISGLSDTLVPPSMMTKLFDLSPAQFKRLVEFPEGTHMDTPNSQGYFPALQQFIVDLLKVNVPVVTV